MQKKSEKYAIAVDIGATYIRVAIGNKKGVLLSQVKEKMNTGKDEVAISEQILRMIGSMEKPDNIVGICIGAAGRVNTSELSVYSPNLACKEFSLKNIAEKLEMPILLLNDCNAAVLGVKKFEAPTLQNLIYITISSGIGSGIIENGRLVSGKDRNAGEAGHIVVDYNGKLKCGCGGLGHWESYTSGKNIPIFFNLWSKNKGSAKNITAEDIFNRAQNKDKTALEFINELGKINAAGIASLVNIFNPEEIFLGGSVVLNNKRLVLDSITRALKNYQFIQTPKIKISSLEDNAVLLGALAAIFEGKPDSKI